MYRQTVKFVLRQIITDINSYDHNVMIIEFILATDRKQFKKVNGQVFFQVSDDVMLENCFFRTSEYSCEYETEYIILL